MLIPEAGETFCLIRRHNPAFPASNEEIQEQIHVRIAGVQKKTCLRDLPIATASLRRIMSLSS
jgi:hypothetical protein